MNAIVVTSPKDSRRSEAEAESEHYLPEVTCDACGETWGDTEVWYPSLSLKEGVDTYKYQAGTTVDMRELSHLRKQLAGMGKRKLRLVPGAGIGQVTAELPKNPTDFVWSAFKLLASRRVVAAIEEQGITLPHGPAIAKLGHQTGNLYVALELDLVPPYSEQTLKETTLVYCSRCGSCEMQDPNPQNLNGLMRYVRKRMPQGHGLVRVNESYATLASEAFVGIVRSKGFTGLEFLEEGIYM